MSGGIELAAPLWLGLLPVLIVAALLWRLAGPGEPASLGVGRRTPARLFHPLASLLGGERHNATGFPLWKRLALWGALAAMVLAMAQPERIGARLPEPPRQRDVVFIVDTSVGMLLRDYVVEGERLKRIDMLKQVLDGLVQQLPNDRIGVVVFGKTAHTLVPLSDDHQLVRHMLMQIDTDIVGRYSAVGDAIAMAVREAGEEQASERRILVLFTAVNRPAGTIAPLAAAELAAEAQLQVFTVAIGATSEEAAEGETAGLIYQPVDLELLERIAERTGASGYHAENLDTLTAAVRDITAREPQTREGEPVYERQALYHWPLGVAALLLLICTFRLPRRGGGR